jgi:hypothetical protein
MSLGCAVEFECFQIELERSVPARMRRDPARLLGRRVRFFEIGVETEGFVYQQPIQRRMPGGKTKIAASMES